MNIEEMNRVIGAGRDMLLQPLLDSAEAIRRHPQEAGELFRKMQICGWYDVDAVDGGFVLGLASLKILELLVELSADETAEIVKGN